MATVFGPIYGMTPLFGTLLTGLPARGLNSLFGLAAIGLGYGVYRLKPVAWILAICLPLVAGASTDHIEGGFGERRDLDALAMAGVPVYSMQGRGGGWRLVQLRRT